MLFTVFTVLVVFAAIAGFTFQKNGELSGLGRSRGKSALRAPHGRLIRTKRLDATEDVPYARAIARLLVFELAICAVMIGICLLGVLDPATSMPAIIHFVLAVGLAVGITQVEAGIWRSFAYALCGYLLIGGAASYAALAWALSFPFIDTGFINMTTMLFGGVGCAITTAAMPQRRAYAREFEDGYVNSIQLSARAFAVREYERLADPSWIPPADRIDHPNMADELRESMESRAKSADR